MSTAVSLPPEKPQHFLRRNGEASTNFSWIPGGDQKVTFVGCVALQDTGPFTQRPPSGEAGCGWAAGKGEAVSKLEHKGRTGAWWVGGDGPAAGWQDSRAANWQAGWACRLQEEAWPWQRTQRQVPGPVSQSLALQGVSGTFSC